MPFGDDDDNDYGAQPDWQQRFDAQWGLSRRGVPLPPDADWRTRGALKPFERNLLRNPNPEGVNVSEPAPPCSPEAPCKPQDYEGLFKGWQISTEPVTAAHKEVHPRFDSLRYSWCVKQQCIDLLAEGLWVELLDLYQPNITVLDWYENSKLANSVYELHVQLLGTDEATVIGEFRHVAEERPQDGENKNWQDVSHVFQRYGPGVRYVHFLHKTKQVETLAGLRRTRATDSSVSVQLRD
ncbi:F-box only protein 50 [Elgaria multicarinata webbii]|uniref:F-box only protein 50 n=1 Tax=Elgaria multicarinata webbii TaxID=159646 RepID=UPI002FCCC919